MNTVDAALYSFMLIAALSAIAILFSNNVFRSALLLLVVLISIAAIYAILYAEFLAVTQLLIYAGGILVLIIFGIMLTTRIAGAPLKIEHTNLFGGILISLGLIAILCSNLYHLPQPSDSLRPEGVSIISIQIFTKYGIAFEIAGLLLLIALIGAAIIASQNRRESDAGR